MDATVTPPAGFRGKIVVVVAALFLVLIVLLAAAGLLRGWKNIQRSSFGFLIAGFISAIGNAAALFIAVHHGLGSHSIDLSASQLLTIKKCILIVLVALVFSGNTGSLAYLCLLKELARVTKYHPWLQMLQWVLLIGAFASLLALLVVIFGFVGSIQIILLVTGSYQVLVQVVCFTLCLVLVAPLQTRWETKTKTICFFGTILLASGATVYRMYITPKQTFAPDFPYNDFIMLIVMQFDLHLALLSSLILNIPHFVHGTSTGVLAEPVLELSNTARSNAVLSHARSDCSPYNPVFDNEARVGVSSRHGSQHSMNSTSIMVRKDVYVKDDYIRDEYGI